MTNEEIIELTKTWFENIEAISTRKDISDEDKLLRIKATCQRCKNFLDNRETCEHHKDKFRLPTKDDFDKLCKCYTRFDEELKGRWFFDKGTGEELFLPCEGYSYKDSIFNDEILGNYWSSSFGPYQHCGAYYLDFTSNRINTEIDLGLYRRNVRLVSDEPFEGSIRVAGLYWKPENEVGYYTWDEAMEKFSNKN